MENTPLNIDARVHLKKKMHSLHRIIGLMAIIPVIFWALSGLMHPFMAHWFKPQIAREFMVPAAMKQEQIKLSVQEVLRQHSIEQLKGFRLVAFNDATFYQIKKTDGTLIYFDAASGKELPDGDRVYAEWLARFFLGDQQSAVASIGIHTDFSQQYKYINRLLPVWKVSFDRTDGMDLYVETASSRLGTFNTSSRKAFLWIFDNFHNWTWADGVDSNSWRKLLMSMALGIIICSALSGIAIYGIFWKRFANAKNEKGSLLKYHRQIGLAVSLVTLSFAGSGAYHLLHKPKVDRLSSILYEPIMKATQWQMPSLQAVTDWQRFSNLSVVKLQDTAYFRVSYTKSDEKPSEVQYVHAQTGAVLENGDIVYAKFLANRFAPLVNKPEGMSDCCALASAEESVLLNDRLQKTAVLTKFESREYGFVFKRLPVVQLIYEGAEAYYIETATSHLAAHIQDSDRREGYSFAIFHKYLLMDWAGKDVRDAVTVLAALGVLSVSLLGLAVWLKRW